jgi:AMMECR1 domain-containing protein
LLPQVWSSLPDACDFLRALKRKAGLPAHYWGPDLRLERYTVTHFDETPEAVA